MLGVLNAPTDAPTDVGVGALPDGYHRVYHGVSWCIICLLFMRTAVSGVHTVIIAPVPNTKTKLKNKASKKQKTTAPKGNDTIQPACGAAPNWVLNTTTIVALGVLLPGLFSLSSTSWTRYISTSNGGSVHTHRPHRLPSPPGYIIPIRKQEAQRYHSRADYCCTRYQVSGTFVIA